KSAGLQQMVIIGHSQGGLLAKLTATDTGDKLWQVTTNNRAGSKLTTKQRDFLEEYVVYEHLPFVKRVVFICTPHRGSYLANDFVRDVARLGVRLPGKMVKEAAVLSGIQGTVKAPTSLDSMSTHNQMLLALAEIPLAPGIKGHSIIAVPGAGDY